MRRHWWWWRAERRIASKEQIAPRAAGCAAASGVCDRECCLNVPQTRPEEELHTLARLCICQHGWVGWRISEVVHRPGCSTGKCARGDVDVHARRHLCARDRAQRRLEVFICWHCELLSIIAVRIRVEVIRGHRRERLTRQDDWVMHLRAAVGSSVCFCVGVAARRFVVHRCAVARAPSRIASLLRTWAEARFGARTTARCP